MYSEKSLTWNGITQQNRNGLLWNKQVIVDGLKTGHTSGAGFNLIASAVDGQRRLIAVVMGADSAKGREEEARKLLRGATKLYYGAESCTIEKVAATRTDYHGDKENSPGNRTRKVAGWYYRKPKLGIFKAIYPLMVKSSPRQLAPISG